MKTLCKVGCCLIAAVAAFGTFAETYRVTPDAAGGGNGLAWTADGDNAPMTLAEAVGTAENGDVLLLRHGTYSLDAGLSLAKTVTVRGGYAGTDDVTLDTDDAASVLDGGMTVTVLVAHSDATAGNGSVFERIRFEHAANNGFVKTGAADVSFFDCGFSFNGKDGSNVGGNGLNITGTADTKVVISNCVFAGNHASTSGKTGVGCSVTTALNVLVEDTLFVSNGVPLGANPDTTTAPEGAALFAKNAVVDVRRCDFRANRGRGSKSSASGGGIVALEGACGGSSFRNCLWAGNTIPTGSSYHGGTMSGSTYNNGMLYVHLSAQGDALDVMNCTFAYNHAYTACSPVGLNVSVGTVNVGNSIFFGNITGVNVTMPKDVYVQAGATVQCAYTLFEATNSTCLAAAAGGTIGFGDGMVTGDPGFVSPPTVLSSMLKVYNTSDGYQYTYPDPAKSVPALAQFDCHVTSELSPAVDSGDPDDDYSREPKPDGRRVNLGAYGNTPEAHASPDVQPIIVDDRVEVTFPYNTTQPHVAFTVGGKTPVEFKATVEIYWSTNGTDYVQYRMLTDVNNGYVFDEDVPLAFMPGDNLHIRVSVYTSGSETMTQEASEPLDYPLPEHYGLGGGAGIVHVRPGATGDGSGRDWFHAIASVEKLSGDLGGGCTQVWVAGSNVCAGARSVLRVQSDVVFRGGFTGKECALSERACTARSVIDGDNAYQTFSVENVAGAEVTFERLSFRHSSSSGLVKTGAGGLVVRDCGFESNNLNETAASHGVGLSVTGGGSETTVVLTNCLFAGNLATNGDDRFGLALYVSTAGRVVVEDSLFVSNGVPVDATFGFGESRNVNNFKACGVALYAKDAQLDVRRCAFRGNRGSGITHGSGASQNRGGIVALTGSCDGSAFRNCLWSGNVVLSGKSFHEEAYSVYGTYNNGMVWINLTDDTNVVAFANCTFAYNHVNAKFSPVCLNVGKGTAEVLNSIFYGNTTASTHVYPIDLWVASGAQAKVDYSMFESTNQTYVSCADINYGGTISAGTPAWGGHVMVADPLLVDGKTDFEQRFEIRESEPGYGAVYTGVKDGCWGALSSLNVHLRGGSGYADELTGETVKTWARAKWRSPAIDAGDPAVRCVEPHPNGNCVNLGAYGNTPWATMSKGGLLILVE